MEEAIERFAWLMILTGGGLVIVDFVRKQYNIDIPVENAVYNFYSGLNKTPLLELPRFIIRSTLGVLGAFAAVLNLIAGLSLIIGIFFLVSIVGVAYDLNNASEAFEQIRPAVKAYRDFQFWLILGSGFGGVIIGGLIGFLVTNQEEDSGPSLLVGILSIVFLLGYFLAVGLSLYVTTRFALSHYGSILSVSLSGTPLQAIKTQLVLFPLNSLAFGFPIFIITILLLTIPRIRRSLARALLGNARQLNEMDFGERLNAYNQIIARLGLTAGITASFVLTAVAVAIGIYATPIDSFELSTQLFLSNVLFDALTLLATIVLLGWALGQMSWIRLPFAIMIDLVLACVFAILSIYFGLLGSTDEITVGQAIIQLVGQDSMGNAIAFGPLFWAMHTAFIPTMIFWMIIVFGVVGKFILLTLGKALNLDVNVAAITVWGGVFSFVGTLLLYSAAFIAGTFDSAARILTNTFL